jgi:hypothetical protein
MKLNWQAWLYGLVSGFIGGGAGSIGAAFGGMVTDFDHFNPGTGLHHLLALMGTTFLFSGIITAAAYLSKSPLPQPIPPREVWTPEQRAAAAPKP